MKDLFALTIRPHSFKYCSKALTIAICVCAASINNSVSGDADHRKVAPRGTQLSWKLDRCSMLCVRSKELTLNGFDLFFSQNLLSPLDFALGLLGSK